MLSTNCVDMGAVCIFQWAALYQHKPSLRVASTSIRCSQKSGIHPTRTDVLTWQNTFKTVHYIKVYERITLLSVSNWINISKKFHEPGLCSPIVGLDIVRIGAIWHSRCLFPIAWDIEGLLAVKEGGSDWWQDLFPRAACIKRSLNMFGH